MVTINFYHGMPTKAMIRNLSVHDTPFGGRTASARPGTCAGSHHQQQEGWGQQAEGHAAAPIRSPPRGQARACFLPGLCPRGRLGQKKKKAPDLSLTKAPGLTTDSQNARGEAQWTPRECNLGRQTVGKGTGQMTLFLHQGQKRGGGEGEWDGACSLKEM